ncbi:hypothetical protein FA95DRAFT_1556819 [Auriscalpium vulgare]|uniref:Uncharacterized protein n=1 Tax=Auriscalpium vulgare TaxID=40419 RepID=A0ACB8RZ67_9AGAM|nr:hypothetical protein FA95DRAFT_1556819 [Auriscalpium vulgare]
MMRPDTSWEHEMQHSIAASKPANEKISPRGSMPRQAPRDTQRLLRLSLRACVRHLDQRGHHALAGRYAEVTVSRKQSTSLSQESYGRDVDTGKTRSWTVEKSLSRYLALVYSEMIGGLREGRLNIRSATASEDLARYLLLSPVCRRLAESALHQGSNSKADEALERSAS